MSEAPHSMPSNRVIAALAGLYAALALAGEALAFHPTLSTKLVGAALLCAVTLEATRSPPDWRRVASLGLPVALLALWSAASIRWSLDPEASQARAAHLAFEALLVSALLAIRDRPRALRAIGWGGAAAALVLAGGFVVELATAHGARLHPFETHPNLQGRDAALGGLAAALLLPAGPIGWAAAALGGLAAGLSFSAGAWLAAVGASVVAFISAPDRRRGVAALLLGLVLGAGLLTMFGSQPGSKLRSPATALGGDAVEEIGSGRLVLWAHAARIAAAHPLLGVGAGAFPAALEEVRAAHQRAGGEHSKPGRRAHSVYLDLLAESGPLGLAVFLLPLWLLGAAAWRTRSPIAGALLAFVALSAATDSLLHQKSLWLALALAALAQDRER